MIFMTSYVSLYEARNIIQSRTNYKIQSSPSTLLRTSSEKRRHKETYERRKKKKKLSKLVTSCFQKLLKAEANR